MTEEKKFVHIKLEPSRFSQIRPLLSFEFKVSETLCVQHILLVLRKKLLLKENKALFLFAQNKILHPKKVLSQLAEGQKPHTFYYSDLSVFGCEGAFESN